MIPLFLGLPMMHGKTEMGASCPENPAFVYPDPLSKMICGLSVLNLLYKILYYIKFSIIEYGKRN